LGRRVRLQPKSHGSYSIEREREREGERERERERERESNLFANKK